MEGAVFALTYNNHKKARDVYRLLEAKCSTRKNDGKIIDAQNQKKIFPPLFFAEKIHPRCFQGDFLDKKVNSSLRVVIAAPYFISEAFKNRKKGKGGLMTVEQTHKSGRSYKDIRIYYLVGVMIFWCVVACIILFHYCGFIRVFILFIYNNQNGMRFDWKLNVQKRFNFTMVGFSPLFSTSYSPMYYAANKTATSYSHTQHLTPHLTVGLDIYMSRKGVHFQKKLRRKTHTTATSYL